MRILVVCGHKVIGQSLVSMLVHLPWDEPVEAQRCDPHQASEYATSYLPHLLLVDASGDYDKALGIVDSLAHTSGEVPIVVLGNDEAQETMCRAVLAGASGYVAHDTSQEVLLATLRSVHRGELGLSRRAALDVVRQLRLTVETAETHRAWLPRGILSNLTRREREVFELFSQGLRTREIARRLVIAETTAYKHTQNVLHKLKVHSRAEAIFLANLAALEPPHPALGTVRVIK